MLKRPKKFKASAKHLTLGEWVKYCNALDKVVGLRDVTSLMCTLVYLQTRAHKVKSSISLDFRAENVRKPFKESCYLGLLNGHPFDVHGARFF